MAYFARIENGVVREIAVYDLSLEQVRSRYHSSLEWVEADASTKEGMLYKDGVFTTESVAGEPAQ